MPGSSTTFVNTAIQIKADVWNEVNKTILEFRKKYKEILPLRLEVHTNQIINGKGNYNELKLTNEEIKGFFREYAKQLAKLDILATTVLIDKMLLVNSKDVFVECVDRLVNRINTTINNNHKKDKNKPKYLLFCDQGRIQKWEKQVEYMKSSNILYNKKQQKLFQIQLKNLIEKPISRDSSKSPLLQAADFIVTLFGKYHQYNFQNVNPKSRTSFFDNEFIVELLKILQPILNKAATKKNQNEFGLVIFPYNKKNTTL